MSALTYATNECACGRTKAARADQCRSCWRTAARPSRPVEERFWEKADTSGGPGACWPWLGYTVEGYGRFTLNDVPTRAHRVAFELTRGPMPIGLDVDHLCRNRACVNPAHMEPVTRAANTRRGVSYWGTRTECHVGHPFDESNTYSRNGRRHCRACRKQSGHEAYLRRRAKVAA